MDYRNNKGCLTFWQVILSILALIAIATPGVVCIYTLDVRVSTTPPKTVAVVTPTTPPPNVIFEVLTEEARKNTSVQVVTAGTGIFWAWYAVPVGFIAIGLGVGYWGLRYGLRGQTDG